MYLGLFAVVILIHLCDGFHPITKSASLKRLNSARIDNQNEVLPAAISAEPKSQHSLKRHDLISNFMKILSVATIAPFVTVQNSLAEETTKKTKKVKVLEVNNPIFDFYSEQTLDAVTYSCRQISESSTSS